MATTPQSPTSTRERDKIGRAVNRATNFARDALKQAVPGQEPNPQAVATLAAAILTGAVYGPAALSDTRQAFEAEDPPGRR